MPDATVIDVTSGEKLRLTTLVPASRPILFWFYAPH
jgi:hypothetical protein